MAIPDVKYNFYSRNKPMKTMIYFDLDGVLADWVKGYESMQNMPNIHDYNRLPKDERNKYKENFHKYDFFRDLPVIEKGMKLLKAVMEKTSDVCILSAVGDYNKEEVENAKRDWVDEHIGDINCLFVDKVHMKNQKMVNGYDIHILIDDREIAINAWEDNEGIGILFAQ